MGLFLSDEKGMCFKGRSFPVRLLKVVDNVVQGTLQEGGGAVGNLRCYHENESRCVQVGLRLTDM